MARPPTVTLLAAALAAGALAAGAARADLPGERPRGLAGDPRPLRIDYQATQGCPGADGFLDEIRWRTALARVAAPGEDALSVQARVARQGSGSSGHLVLGQGAARVTRDIEGANCDEVVSALALVTALAIDPRASTAARPPSPPPGGAPAPPAPPAAEEPAVPAPPPVFPPLPAQLLADPLPVLVEPAALDAGPAARWILGARAALAFGVAPQVLAGGGLFAERAFGGWWSPSLRLSLEAGGTGDIAAGPGGVSFVRGLGRVEGCGFAAHPARGLALVPCLAVEGGALHAQGILQGSLSFVRQTTVPWLGAGALPRAGVELGPLVLDVQGGPIFPAVRRSFVFETPSYVVQELPPVTWTVGLDAGGHFP